MAISLNKNIRRTKRAIRRRGKSPRLTRRLNRLTARRDSLNQQPEEDVVSNEPVGDPVVDTPKMSDPLTTDPNQRSEVTSALLPQAPQRPDFQAPEYKGIPYEEVQNKYLDTVKNLDSDPLYQRRQDQGLKKLGQFMASRGLTGSGPEAAAASEFLAELGGTENRRLQDLGQQEANRLQELRTREGAMRQQYDLTTSQQDQQNQQFYADLEATFGRDNANRLFSLLQDRATRQDTQSNQQWGRIMDLLNLSASQSPAPYAFEGTRESARMGADRAKWLENSISKLFERVVPNINAGGGGVPPTFRPPPGSGVNGEIDLAKIVGDHNQDKSKQSVIENFISSLF
jgi:hypothetical protein